MDILLDYIYKRTRCSHCKSGITKTSGTCERCESVIYCNSICQKNDWNINHKYVCIGGGLKRFREKEEELTVDFNDLKSIMPILMSFLNVKDAGNFRSTSKVIERKIRQDFFNRFRVTLSEEDNINFSDEIIPYIKKVRDDSGGVKAAKFPNVTDVEIYGYIDWTALYTLLDHKVTKLLLNTPMYVTVGSLGEYTNLQKLHVTRNMTEIPESYSKLVNLTELNLQHNKIVNLPEFLPPNLIRLNLKGNLVVDYSTSLLSKLESLDISRNGLLSFDSICKIISLTELDISGSVGVPTCIGNLVNLKSLNMQTNGITKLPSSMSDLHNLEYLNLGENRLTGDIEPICWLTNLVHLSLYWNQLKELPDCIGNLVNLTKLGVGSNRLEVLTDSIVKLDKLVELNLGSNQYLRKLPRLFGNLKRLKVLKLNDCKGIVLPESFGKLFNLVDLNLKSVDFEFGIIPKVISNLYNLKILTLSYNSIVVIPDWIGDLTNLVQLTISNNRITTLPLESLKNLVNLKTLKVGGNRISDEEEEEAIHLFGKDVVTFYAYA